MLWVPPTMAVAAVLLCACSDAAPEPIPSSASASPAATGPELWASVAVWTSPEGDVSVCGVPFLDSGFGGPRVCDEPLSVSGLDATTLPKNTPPPVPAEEPGWSWSAHLVTGHIDGDHLTVTGVDTPEAVAAQAAAYSPPPVPASSPAYATDEEKSAAMFAEADPAGYGCTAPEGGWKDAGDIEGLIGPYSAGYPGQVVGWAPLWVADGVQVALIGAAAGADLEAVHTGMQKLFPDAACVVTSTVSWAELERALDEPLFGPDPHVARSGSDANGRTTADPYLWVGRTAPSDELDAALAEYPPGFIQLHTWFARLP
jgi:hypothetical protein